ncbi:MAG: hypothetical protein WBM81_09085, partial [Sedimenticolaceae bacterium]
TELRHVAYPCKVARDADRSNYCIMGTVFAFLAAKFYCAGSRVARQAGRCLHHTACIPAMPVLLYGATGVRVSFLSGIGQGGENL